MSNFSKTVTPVSIIGDIEISTTGLATSANQASELTQLQSINTTLGSPLTVGLPSGAATAAKQDTGNASLASIDTKLANPLPVSASSLPLPTGASTSANQSTGNSFLSSIDTKTPSLGQAVSASSSPVVIASNQSAVPVAQQTTVSATTTLTGNGTAAVSTAGAGTAVAVISGTWASTINFEATVDGSNWVTITGAETALLTNQSPVSTSTNGTWQFNTSGFTQFRLRGVGVTGTATVAVSSSPNMSVLTAILSNSYVNQSGIWTVASSEAYAQNLNTASQVGYLMLASATTAVPTYTTAKTNPLNMNTSGGLRSDVAQINGVTPLMGTGVTGTGSLRVTLATDQSILTNAWKSNTAQINGVVPLMGNGVTGTGAQRVTISSDNTRLTNQFSTRADTFITTASGVTVSSLTNPMSSFSVGVKATGAVTSWDVRLEGSNDNVNFTTLLTHTNVTPGDGLMIFSGTAVTPCLYFRSRCAGLVLGAGTNVVVTILGIQ